MKPTLGNSSPWCHSTLATTLRDTFQASTPSRSQFTCSSLGIDTFRDFDESTELGRRHPSGISPLVVSGHRSPSSRLRSVYRDDILGDIHRPSSSPRERPLNAPLRDCHTTVISPIEPARHIKV